MHGSQRCCCKVAELTVDSIWQIAGAGDSNFRDCHIIGKMHKFRQARVRGACVTKWVAGLAREGEEMASEITFRKRERMLIC